jgi:hypothetical protein
MVKMLISEFKANVHFVDSDGWTPLSRASSKGHLDIVKVLISEFKAEVQCTNSKEWTPLHHACWNGHLDIVKVLISEFKVGMHCTDSDGWTPLHHACKKGHSDIVRLLISEFKSDVGTSLHQCASSGSMECLQILLSADSPLIARSTSGKTPIDVATPECKTLIDDYIKKYEVHYAAVSTKVRLSMKSLTFIKWRNEQGAHEFRLISQVASMWKDFGLRLGCEPDELQSWETEYRYNAVRCWEKVMNEWVNRAGTDDYPATWWGLVQVLEDLKLNKAARELVRVLPLADP